MRTGRFLLILIILISACSLFFIFSDALLKHLASGLVVNHKVIKSDAVFVLGGGSPSRALEAIDIHNDGMAELIVLSRGGKPDGIDYLRSRNIKYFETAERDSKLANQLGVPKKNIVILPERLYSTREEAEAIKEFSLKNGYTSIIIATSMSHSRRTELTFNRIFKDSGINVIIKPTRYDSFDPKDLDKNKKDDMKIGCQ